VPTTTDVATIALFVPELAADLIPVPGNRPERALRMAGDILKRSVARQREIVWITAGSQGAELPLGELAGVRVSVLQVAGADDPALVGAASRSGGAFVWLRADDADVRALVKALAVSEDWKAAAGSAVADAADLGYWLLLPLLALAALAFRRGVLALLLGPLLLSGLLAPQPAAAQNLPLAALWADYQGWRLLEAGDAQAAATRFVDTRWRAVAHYRAGQFDQAANVLSTAPDADAHYNRGNGLAKQGKLSEALAAFETALALRPLDADTRHNRDLMLLLLKQQSEAPKSGAGGATPPGGAPSTAGQTPAAPGPAQSNAGAAEQEAARVAEQWLRSIPDQPGSLLRRKLQAEHQRRQAGAARAW
jgi:Ca-activated chloride channel homolog